ncbi:MAG: TIGR00304 family membrane protein [Methanosarcina sp.]
MYTGNLLKAGIVIIFIGFLMLLLGIVLTIIQGSSNSQFGGIIMIGPIPIVFGSSPEITTTMLGLGLLIMIIYLFLWKMRR